MEIKEVSDKFVHDGQKEIPHELDCLFMMTERLTKAVAELELRLTSVIKDCDDGLAVPPRPECHTLLGGKLRDLTYVVGGEADKIDDLLGRLCL